MSSTLFTMLRTRWSSFFALSLFGCGSAGVDLPPPGQPAAVEVKSTPRADTPEPAPTIAESPAEALARRFPDGHVELTTPWPNARRGEQITAVVVRGKTSDNQSLAWVRPGETGPVSADRHASLAQRGPISLEFTDLDGDGLDEILVFSPEGGTFGSTDVWKLLPGVDSPEPAGALAAAIDGASNLEEVRKRLPLRASLKSEVLATVSTAGFIGRLSLATLADLRAMISSRGVEVCSSIVIDTDRVDTTCKTLRPVQLTDRVLEDEVRRSLLRSLDPVTVMGFECKREGRERCVAAKTGGISITIELEGSGALRRVAKISEADLGLGE